MFSINRVFLLLVFSIAFCATLQAQQVVLDTIFDPNDSSRIWEIVAKRNGQKFGPFRTFDKYGKKGKLDGYQFYIKDSLYGFDVDYRWISNRFTSYRNNVPTFKRVYSESNTTRIHFFSVPDYDILYDSVQNISAITYYDYGETINFYPNKQVKSIILEQPTTPITRNYYEFSEEGYLIVEGIYLDSIAEILDTIIIYDPDTYEEIVQVILHEVPLKHGDWFYYSKKGVLQEKKTYHYFAGRKGRTYYE